MCRGPKSAWKALYNKLLSMVKYMGGGLSCDTACGPCCALDDLLLGGLDCFAVGYGKGVFSSGWWVYEAR